MSLELIIIVVFIALLVFSLFKRILWLSCVAVVIGVLIYFGWFEFLFEFVRQTIRPVPLPIIIAVS